MARTQQYGACHGQQHRLLNTAFLYVTRGPIYVQHVRAERTRAFALRQAEASLHAVLNEKVEKVIHKQQLLVLSELHEDLHFPHHQRLVDLIKTGFSASWPFDKESHLHTWLRDSVPALDRSSSVFAARL